MGTEALIALIAVAATAAGTGVAVSSNIQQGKAADETAKFNAKIAENDALAAQQQAAAEAEQIRRKNRLLSGAQRAGYGKAGVDLSGTEDVLTDSGTQGELEALSALYAGNRAATYDQSRASASRFQGDNAKAAGNLNAAGSLLGGLSSVGTQLSTNPSFRSTGSGTKTIYSPRYKNQGS